MRSTINYLTVLSFIFFLFSCNNVRWLPEGESLYTGADVEVMDIEDKKQKRAIKKEADNLIRPKPNKRFLGLRIKLALYNMGRNPKRKKGIRAWLQNKAGEAPVLYSQTNPSATREIISAGIYNMGYFHSNVYFTTEERKRKIKVTYHIYPGEPYLIDQYVYDKADQKLEGFISSGSESSLLKKGDIYSLEKLKAERERIDQDLRKKGYYYFNGEYLLFTADTTARKGAKQVDLSLDLKSDVPERALRRYRIKNIFVVLDSMAYEDSLSMPSDTIILDNVFISVGDGFNPKPIVNYVYLKRGEYYSREDHQRTLNRLMGMGIFKYVDLKITEASSHLLDVMIRLAPLPKKSITLELQVVSKSNNFIGPGINAGYNNRNLLKGGERLSVNFHGSVETQLNGQFKGLYTYEVGPQVSLTVPKFMVPFYVKVSSFYTPQTIYSVNFNFLRRVNYFDMRSLVISFGYKWRETMPVTHQFMPINISYFNLSNVSPSFNELLAANPILARRYEDQLIEGITYSYTYNEQVYPDKKVQFYFNGNAEVAGTTASLINRATGSERNSIGQRTTVGTAYAQYMRFDIDFRNYINLDRNNKIASRIILGWGIPFGNSASMPYVKSFFAGGASSVRAFSVNSLGPGTYRAADSLEGSYFLQLGGDIKIEANLEYRYPIISVLKGAVFLDAGNTWLMERPGVPRNQVFRFNTCFSELAAGMGIGIRLDLNFFVIRLDLATPVRKPWRQEGDRWVLKDIDFSDSGWRKDNLIFNIAIGYPF